MYHLSDDNTHDFAFTGKVAKDVIDRHTGDLHQVIRFKSDNCAVQCKFKQVFGFWRNLPKELDRTIIVYYGVAGHRKGLVDAASGFGAKDPIRKAIIVEDWFLNSADDIVTYLDQKKGSANKIYAHLPAEIVSEMRNENAPEVSIKGSRKFHYLVFLPDASIVGKEDICSCEDCLIGNILKCETYAGKILLIGEDDNANSDDDDDDACNHEQGDDDQHEAF